MGIGIALAAVDKETTSIVVQAAATGGVVIIAGVFTIAFYYSIQWLNKVHDIEHSVNPVKRRSLKPLGTAVEVKQAHMKYQHYLRAPSDSDHNNTTLASSSQSGDELDIPIITMASSDDVDGSNEDVVYMLDYIGGNMMKPFTTTHLRTMKLPAIILLFLSSVLFLLGLMALVWGVTLAYSFGFGDENVIWPFITVEAIVGLACPFLMYIGIILFGVVLDYVTNGRIDARKAVHTVLPSVQLLKAEQNEYWVIKDTFYFLIRKRPQGERTSCTTAWDCSRATIYFVIIIGLSFGLATSYFMNRTIVEQVNTRECRNDLHYDCFVLEDNRWMYVDCSDNETLSRHSFIHCYTFLRFAIDNNPISSLAEAFAFHLVTVGFFGQVFGIVKILLRLRPSRLWGIWFVLIGLVVIAVSLFLIFFRSSFSIHRDVIGCFQIMMVGLFLLTIGFLLFEAGLWEREKVNSINQNSKELRLFKPGHRHALDKAIDQKTTTKEHDTPV